MSVTTLSTTPQRVPSLSECGSPAVPVLDRGEAERRAALLKALADPLRLRLLSIVASHEGGEACVCDLLECFELSQPTISHHLKVLREAGLITGERRATWVYYRIEPDVLEALAAVLGWTDANGIAYSRAPGDVLNIVYLTPAKTTKGGFFPAGVNGAINQSDDND